MSVWGYRTQRRRQVSTLVLILVQRRASRASVLKILRSALSLLLALSMSRFLSLTLSLSVSLFLSFSVSFSSSLRSSYTHTQRHTTPTQSHQGRSRKHTQNIRHNYRIDRMIMKRQCKRWANSILHISYVVQFGMLFGNCDRSCWNVQTNHRISLFS